MPHAPCLWGGKAAVVLAPRGKQTAWKSLRLGGGLRQGLFPTAASTRPFNTIWPPTHAHSGLPTIWHCLQASVRPLRRKTAKLFLLSQRSLATFPVWTTHTRSHCEIRILSEWMSSVLWLRLVPSEPFLQHSAPQWAVSVAVAMLLVNSLCVLTLIKVSSLLRFYKFHANSGSSKNKKIKKKTWIVNFTVHEVFTLIIKSFISIWKEVHSFPQR